MWLGLQAVFPGVAPADVYLHPVARAAWVGLFATALNLLAGEYPGRLHVLPLDVAAARSREELVRELPLVLGEDRLDLLVRLNAARDSGLLTDEEFSREKGRLMGV